MANELNTATGTAGQTVTAKLVLGVTSIGPITCSEVSGLGGYYSGSVPGGTAAGTYSVLFYVGGSQVDKGVLEWDGTAEVTGVTLNTAIVNISGGGGGTIENNVTIPPAVAIASLTPALIACVRGDTLSIALPTLMGDISGRTKLVFTVKAVDDANSDDNTDAMAILQVVENTGLTSLNGTQAGLTAGNASLTVTNGTTGAVTLVVKPSATAQLLIQDLVWDCQWISSSGVVSSPISGTFSVVPDVTQATS